MVSCGLGSVLFQSVCCVQCPESASTRWHHGYSVLPSCTPTLGGGCLDGAAFQQGPVRGCGIAARASRLREHSAT